MNRLPPRVPGLPTYVSALQDPPMAGAALAGPAIDAPVPADGIGQEVFETTIAFPRIVGEGVNPPDTKIWQTKRRWKAIDVHVTANPNDTAVKRGKLSIMIYARVLGARVLVGSGRMQITTQSTNPTPVNQIFGLVPQWVAGARTLASTFEVVFNWSAPLGTRDGSFTVTCIASDLDTPVPSGVGELTILGPNFGLYALSPPSLPRCELVGVAASLSVASPRWLHVYDGPNPKTAGELDTFAPLFSLPLGATIGLGLVDRLIRYRANAILMMVPSSTQFVTTHADDVQLAVTVR